VMLQPGGFVLFRAIPGSSKTAGLPYPIHQ
jgi:hypothetical protein